MILFHIIFFYREKNFFLFFLFIFLRLLNALMSSEELKVSAESTKAFIGEKNTRHTKKARTNIAEIFREMCVNYIN